MKTIKNIYINIVKHNKVSAKKTKVLNFIKFTFIPEFTFCITNYYLNNKFYKNKYALIEVFTGICIAPTDPCNIDELILDKINSLIDDNLTDNSSFKDRIKLMIMKYSIDNVLTYNIIPENTKVKVDYYNIKGKIVTSKIITYKNPVI